MALIKRLIKLSAIIAVLLLVLCAGAGRAAAAIEPYQQKIQGQLKKGDTLLVKDEKFENPAYDWNGLRNNSVLNVITFGLYRDSIAAFDKPFSCKADLKVEYWSQPGQTTPITIEHVKLEINYDTAVGAVYQVSAQYDFKNAYKIKITINDISSQELQELPPAFSLNAQVIVNRDYLPKSGQTLVPSVYMNTNPGEATSPQKGNGMVAAAAIIPGVSSVSVNWDVIPGAQKYDLEWTFIDELSANGAILAQSGTSTSAAVLATMFRNNSTRVTIAQNSYTISLINNNKYLLIRLRTVDESGTYRNESAWSYQIKSDGVTVAGVVILTNSWHEPGLNWQYDATYAEEGKKKEVVSYFDGTLRNRQTVTINNSDAVTLVQENIYDQFGRPVANILPAAIDSQRLNYHSLFNRKVGGGAYTYANVFKGMAGYCIDKPDVLDPSIGASKYYSPANPFLTRDPYNKYIPDAEGLPLAITSYTPDNTGRIAVKGGVGAILQPSTTALNNHSTRYYYGKPEQWELDRLFGNDAGFADHYLKNMVIDANGQISISYQNAAGKTIATALTGSTPDTSLLALPSKPAAVKKSFVLLQPDRFVYDPVTLKLTATTTYLASVPDATAAFTFSIDKLIKKYVQNGVTICSNCYYELKINMSDDCNNRILDLSNIKRGSALSDCNQVGTVDTTFTAPLNKIGEYYITFELALNPRVIESYTKDFVTRNTNLKTQFQFVMEQLAREDFTGCFSECTTCKDALGAKADFMRSLKVRMQQNGVDTIINLAALNTWSGGLYDALYSNCQALRTTCLASPCDRLKSLLAQDVSPGGQYAMFDSAGTALETDINVLYLHWRDSFPVRPAGDALYEANKFQMADGSYISPCDASFTLQMLVRFWQPQWGDKFVVFHPEACALKYCNDNSNYKTWDQRLSQIYTTVADIPQIKAGLAYDINNGSWLLVADPFFAPGGKGYTLHDAFKADLDNYASRVLHLTDSRLNNKSLSQYVDYELYCMDSTGTANGGSKADFMLRWNQCAPGATCRIPDRQWQSYVNYYLEVKEKYYQQQMSAAGYCKGGCAVGGVPVISTGGMTYPPPPSTTLTCSDFNLSMFNWSLVTQNQSQTIFKISKISGPAIPTGVTIVIKIWAVSGGFILDDDVTFSALDSDPQLVFFPPNYTVDQVEFLCAGPPPVTPSNPCPVAYNNKISRINNFNYAESVSFDTATYLSVARDSLALQIQTSCSVTIDNWLAKLAGCSQYVNLSASTKSTFRTRLTEICTLGGDINHIYGSSTTIGGKTNSDGDTSFEQVIRRYLGVTPFNMLCNPWLLDVPYPANVKAQTVTRIIDATDNDICVKLNALKQEQQTTQPGVTFYNFLLTRYSKGMTITSAELDALLKGCTNCRYLLDREVKLPVFLDGTAKGCITPLEFWTARNDFKVAMGNTVDSTHANYQNVYRNYLNQRWGFTLSFSDYDSYRKRLPTSPAETLCNTPVYTTVPVDPYACMLSLVDGAVTGAKRMYDMYIDSVKQDFRRQYINVCSTVHSKVNLNTSQQIYHYTLYYYDQAGNLLRTVPPEGVNLIEDAEKLEQIERARTADYSQCNYNGPQRNTNPDTTLNRLGTALTGTNQSVEMWLFNPDAGPTQVLTPGGGKVYFDICVDGSYLHASVYKLQIPSPGAVDIVASNSVDVNISALLPLAPWTHVVLQGPDLDSSGIISVFVNGVSCPAVTTAPPGGCGWDITAAASGNAIFAQNLSYLRQIRMYKRLLTSAEIAANAKESCLGLAAAYSTALLRDTITWGRFNTPSPGSPTTLPDGGTTEVQTTSVYPKHGLTTDYAYNSLGQVMQQYTPDAHNSYFWYDLKGRLFASRNANQYLGTNQYSYTKYDALGRITEVGEKKNAQSLGVPAFVTDAVATQFLGSGTSAQITRTFYDVAQLDNSLYPQDNLRKRVAASVYLETEGTVEQGSYYSYDALGNVKTLWQKLYGLYEMKKVDYNYDLVSGKVNAVRYQQSKPDQFFYNYEYDAENRLINAYSGITHSGDNWTIERLHAATNDAYYSYYKHGPLARMRIGKNGVQGIDYAYTLQGWLKAINGTGLTPANDIGKDGLAGSPASTIAKDVMAYSLDYFTGDYKPIGGTGATALSMKYTASPTDISGQDLFNGNISRTTVALSKFNAGNPVGYSYRYDQLNRLIRMRQHQPAVGATAWAAAQKVEDFQEDISYDGNGNILSYFRNGTRDTTLAMDNLNYFYPRDAAGKLTANTLRHIRDQVNNSLYKSDLESMADDNYIYDQTGNLIKDVASGITSITWSVYGKIKSISFSNGSSLSYKYDASGNRIYKEYTKAGTTSKTWYLRDAQGNSLAVYDNHNGNAQTFWKEQHLYGSSRLGMWMPDIQVSGTAGNATTQWNSANLTRYELSNHLGNVMATVSDQQVSQVATVYNMSDYAPFGMQMVGRKWSLGGVLYRAGFNGQEKSDEIAGEGNHNTAEFWEYDTRIGRRWNLDPKPVDGISQYSAFNNSPIFQGDPLGDTSRLSTRIWGAVKGVGSIGEMAIGGAVGIGASWTGVGAVVGGAAVVHGADGASHGFTEMFTGEEEPTYTQQLIAKGLRAGGVSDSKANTAAGIIDGSISLALTAGASYYKSASDATRLASKMPQLTIEGKAPEYINFASPQRTAHIVTGDATGGGHAWFGSWKSFTNGALGKKTMFPMKWSGEQIMHAVSYVTVNNQWVQQTGRAGATVTRSGQPVRYMVEGLYQGVKIKVITTSTEIITAFPIR